VSEPERIRDAYARRAKRGLDDRYSLADPANLYLFQRRERALLDLLRRRRLTPLAGKKIIDVGCGTAELLGSFVRYGASPEDLAGIDLLDDRITVARGRYPSIDLRAGDAQALPFGDESFDVALQFTLLSSVLDATARRRIAAEMLRVLRPGGVIVWYDFIWNPGNRDTKGIGLAELRRLYPGCRVDARRVTLAPPISRRLAPFSWTLCRLLEAAPFLCSHYLAAVEKPPSP
jgi:SAM-dependent methyltransferase